MFQESVRADNFTRDEHKMTSLLCTVAYRNHNRRWDCRAQKLAFSAETVSQGFNRIPHGLLVDNLSFPDFIRSSEDLTLKLTFSQFSTTDYDNHDVTLKDEVAVLRESSQCDKINS